MAPSSLPALSPLDGRYAHLVKDLTEAFSEVALNHTRLQVETEWLIALAEHGVGGVSALEAGAVSALRGRIAGFSESDVARLAELEATTQHDVKAVEYFLREILTELGLSHLAELTHFACTSEDINNLSYALLLRRAVQQVWWTEAKGLLADLTALAHSHAGTPMLSRTHGQPATPTTFGKEIAVFAHRLSRQLRRVESAWMPGKLNGATGTYSAHQVAWPAADWVALSKEFVEGLGLDWNPLTTQIESHDGMAELFDTLAHAGRILHNLATDIWTYISLGYLRQIPQPGTTGSSTMPHKINPIRFENAEANLEISAALLGSLSATLTTTRLQRDLTDSSTLRNIGVAIGHSLVAVRNLRRGLTEIDVDIEVMARDLEANQEVLAEAIQTLIRQEIVAGTSQLSDPYDVVKGLTRGHRLTSEELRAFVDGLDISEEGKRRLVELTPATYTGLAEKLVADYLPKTP
jgi:adenylosuccinate lyase